MLIRSYIPRDLARLTELTIETFGPYYEDSYRPLVGETIFGIQHGNWRADYRGMLTELHDPAQHRYVAVSEANGAIAGYVGWSVHPARRTGRVTILVVAAEHRRQHAGTALCEHAFSAMRAHGAEMVEIGTGGDAFHASARALYQKLGCTQVPTAAYVRQL